MLPKAAKEGGGGASGRRGKRRGGGRRRGAVRRRAGEISAKTSRAADIRKTTDPPRGEAHCSNPSSNTAVLDAASGKAQCEAAAGEAEVWGGAEAVAEGRRGPPNNSGE